jgi:hypothetical protein
MLFKSTDIMIDCTGKVSVDISFTGCCSHKSIKVTLDPTQVDEVKRPRDDGKFRCAESGCLMSEPVVSNEGKYYEREVLERDGRAWIRLPILQAEIQAFAKEELERLQQKQLSPDELKEAGEYISVLEDALSVGRFLNRQGEAELDLIFDFIAELPGGLRRLRDKVAESAQAAIRLTRRTLLREGRDWHLLYELCEKCRVVPELFDLASEFIYDLDKDMQLLLIQTLAKRDLGSKEKDKLAWLNWKVELPHYSLIPEIPQIHEAPQGLTQQLQDLQAAVQDKDNQTRQQLNSLTHEVRTLQNQVSLQIPLAQSLFELPQRLSAVERDLAQRLSSSEHELAHRLSKLQREDVLERVCRLEQELALTQAENQSLKQRLDLMHSEHWLPPLEVESSLLPLSPPAEIIEPPPPKIYSYMYNTSTLHWTDLATQEQGTHTLTDYTFQYYSSLCEVPGELLFVTGGNKRQQELVSIDLRSIAVNKSHNPMLTARFYHSSIYFEDFLYVLGGCNSTYTQKCERYDLQQNRWSEVAPLPVALCYLGVVLMQRHIYVLGGYTLHSHSTQNSDSIFTFSLDSLSWSTLDLKLSSKIYAVLCFKTRADSTELYFIESSKLFKLSKQGQAHQITLVRPLPSTYQNYFVLPFYHNSTIYYHPNSNGGPSAKAEIGTF